MASLSAAALVASRFANFGRVPEGDDAGGGGSGGAAAEEEDFFADAGGGAGSGEGQGDAGGGGTGAGSGAAGEDDNKGAALEVPEWAKSFSGEKKDGELSNQEWLAKVGVKDLDGLAQIARDNQKALRESGRVKVPGEGATEADVKTYREAIGAPLEAKGYEVALPEGASGFEIDTAVLDPMRDIALKYHIPAAAFKEMGEALLKGQLDGFQGELAQHGADKTAKLKEWGAEAEQGKAEFKRGMVFLGLKVGDVQRIQTGYGVGPTMDLLRSIGQRAGEDFFGGNNSGSREQFGVADLAGAKAQLDAMIGDKDTAAKIRAKDPVTVQRYNRLTAAVAHYRQQEAKGS
jgi:hypothetical protein